MTYWALVRYLLNGTVKRYEFVSPQARALSLVALGGYVQVLEEGSADAA